MKKVLLFGALFAFLGLAAYAQDEEKVTDEDLTKYANVEVTFDNYVNAKTDELKAMILENEIFQGGGRYNEIKAAWGDEAKMTEAKITDEEKAAFTEVKDFQESLQSVLKEYKTGLIMDEEILGAGTYNKVLAATKDDPAVKEKLDGMIAEMKAKQEAEEKDIPEPTDGK
ncbi:hypothetical protein LV84_03770 [Algoriphagus ratkowskyi]|uniref:DUF4168 domain-containing protein n=1 Tax=Algoriphagus ratkowskyi TaxID=57028 RepID=A0A2W7QSM7_9BACT|nr:hypothetical protein [Algoriphagus ratkowskyi]PZX51264.1 hypothetical protein LV84_03770 [Algoriphagus ratkowskyi]TXD75944.1 hypothetical protein ESW18_18515 [Algoriphagus ratkowskyi]